MPPWIEQLRRVPLVLFVALYSVVTGGPLLWVAMMSLRTTAEIFKDPYGFPSPAHWEKFADAWTKSNYGTYFWNSTVVCVVDAGNHTALLISPFVKRRTTDSAVYNTLSVLRTIELLLGLRPMTHFDAGAKPMTASFQTTADLSPYTAEGTR